MRAACTDVILTTSVLMWFSVNIAPFWMGFPLLSYQVKVAGGSALAPQVKFDVPEISVMTDVEFYSESG